MLNTRQAITALFFTVLLYSQFSSAELSGVFCPLGCPSSPPGNQLVVYHLFVLSNNPETKFADWVAYEVDIGNFGVTPGRNFDEDPILDAGVTLEIGDYKGANSDSELEADKGHQAPLASFARSDYWYETNYLSNITPQDEDLNQGPWKYFEIAVRDAVSFRNPLYVITGPTYDGTQRKMPNADEEHDVPDGYFKIIYNAAGEAAGFWMPQSAERRTNYCEFKKPLRDIQDMMNFKIPALQESTEVSGILGC